MDEDKINENDKDFNNGKSVVRCAKRIFDGLNKGTKDGTIGVIVKDNGKRAIIRIS